MFIEALNEEADGIDVRGLPCGSIGLKGVPSARDGKTARDQVMSKPRFATIDHQVALQILKSLLKRNEIDYFAHAEHGVETEGKVLFFPPETNLFNQMVLKICFCVPHSDAALIFDEETGNQSDGSQIVSEDEKPNLPKLVGQFVEELDKDSPNDEILRNVMGNIIGDQDRKWAEFCIELDYDIQVNFGEFLIAMIQAL